MPATASWPTWGCAIVLCLSAMTVRGAEPPRLTTASFMALDAQLPAAKGRPNEEGRLNGLKAYAQGQYRHATQSFEMAAAHADKFSQHYLSLMLWHGVGQPPDRVRAYTWADLAAERGARQLLAIREKMWMALSPAEQAQVEALGPEFYARYGDATAKPRAEGAMRAFQRDMTGSRVGYRNQRLDVAGAPAGGAFAQGVGSSNSNYTINQAASPDALYGATGGVGAHAAYWAAQDRLINATVEVGPLRPDAPRR